MTTSGRINHFGTLLAMAEESSVVAESSVVVVFKVVVAVVAVAVVVLVATESSVVVVAVAVAVVVSSVVTPELSDRSTSFMRLDRWAKSASAMPVSRCHLACGYAAGLHHSSPG